MPSNASHIKKIEFLNPDGCYGNIPFQTGKASYECSMTTKDAGALYSHALTFHLVGLSLSVESFLSRIIRSGTIRFYDVAGTVTRLGSCDLPVTFETKESAGGTFGNFAGYTVTVKWENSSGPIKSSFK